MSIALLGACNGGSSVASPSQDAQSCLTGWWRNNPGACICPAEPECRAGDCVAYNVVDFSGGVYRGGSISVSASAGTMSSAGQFDSGSYTIDGTSLHITRTQAPVYSPDFTCTAGQLTLAGQVLVPVDGPLAQALTSVTGSGQSQWSAYPVR
jgi:hypothetical protein